MTTTPTHDYRVEEAKRALAEAARELSRAKAYLLREKLLRWADRYPQLTGFSFDACREYDDQSSYYWCVQVTPEGDDLPTVPSTYAGHAYETPIEDMISDEMCDAEIEPWQVITGQEPDDDPCTATTSGSVTVDELRRQQAA